MPKYIFIIPYRNREENLHFFRRQLDYILEDTNKNDYMVFFIHQIDSRSFNRGAVKNIGFLAVKQLFPEEYKTITLVFNDIDTIPNRKNLLNFETSKGIVKHFYGFNHALGGIVSITGDDFELVNGFPNFWSWGYEDNSLQNRVLQHNLTIDRSQFYALRDPHIIHLNESITRPVNKDEYKRYVNNTKEGINSITNLQYTIEDSFVNVTYFDTGTKENVSITSAFDLTQKEAPFAKSKRPLMRMLI